MNLSPRKGMTEQEITATIDAILREATLEEKVTMMSGRGFFKQFSESGNRWGGNPYRAGGGCERLGVPALYFTDGPRGVARGNSTCFPCSMARGAAFDVDLERRIGEIFGVEARAQGCTLSGAVCMNLLRHPAWGRAQETYGEDPHHLGEMGAALAQGIQTHNVVATVKHFALNSMENARFKVDVIADERTLHEVYLPHFKRALDAGCATVMSAYNKLNGEYCGENRTLLTDILRGEWGFDGFVHSDWVFGVHKQYAAAAGLDVENPEPLVFGEKLVAAVQSGAVEPQAIDQACRRILTVIYRFAAAEDPLPAYMPDLIARESHRAVALEAAEKSAVLLTNDGTLPLKKEKVRKLAVLGRLAALVNTGDFGSSRVRPPYVVTPLEGLTRYLGENAILTADESNLAAARAATKEADATIVVVGYTAKEEGEFVPGDISLGQDGGQPNDNNPHPIGGDRDCLDLPRPQIDLIKAAVESGQPVIVVIVAGSAVLVEEWLSQSNAILQTFYSGMEGGTALAKLVFGDISPSGKLPFTVAKSERDYPHFDKDADRIDYGYYHGYTLFEREGRAPRFPFGHGLSYTRFTYRALKLRRTKDAVEVTVSVRNEGKVAADEIVQIYASFPATAADRPKKLLKAFARLSLEPGETKTVRREVRLDALKWRDPATHTWKLESGRHTIHVGGSSQTALSATIDL